MVTNYKDHVKFWEIWNEPGFDHSYVQGWQSPGSPNNWWDNDPSPCVNHFKAPIQHYIRTLRICYDVIKTVDPDAYVTLPNVSHESFLDAILRNTDNPNQGEISAEYPLAGGAYFDCIAFSSYPDIDGSVRSWNANTNEWEYHRNSDQAAQGIEKIKNIYQNRLVLYGYDGTTYPKKEWILSEVNAPRVAFGPGTMASDELQVNYVTKALVVAQRNDIRQMNFYQLSDRRKENQATSEFDLLGMYKNLVNTTPYLSAIKTNEGIAFTTTNHFINGTTFDESQSAAMNLPTNVDGAAFFDPQNNNYKYVVWAKTTGDLSENASATYSFPASFGLASLTKFEWDFSESNYANTISPDDIALTGRPILLEASSNPNAPLSITCPPNQTIIGSVDSVLLDWPLPTATTSCPNDSLTFIQTSGHPLGTILTSSSIETISYTVSDSCNNSGTCQFTVTASVPQPSISIQCPPDTVVILLPPGQTDTAYLWDPNDIVLSANCGTLSFTQIAGPALGTKLPVGVSQVTYLGLATGCQDSLTISASCNFSIFVFSTPNPTLSVSCPSDTIIIGSDTEVTLDWDLPTATSICTNSDIVTITQDFGPAPGTTFNDFVDFNIGYSFFDSCGDYSACYFNVIGQLTVDTPQINMVCPPDTTIEVPAGSSGKTIEWDLNNIQISTNCGSPQILQTEGIPNGGFFPVGTSDIEHLGLALYDHYSVVTNTCSFEITLKEVVNNNNLANFELFQLYPNPTSEWLQVDIQAAASPQVIIEILNLQGQVLLSQKHVFSNGRLHTSLDLNKIPSGAYLVKAKTNKQLALKPFTVLK